MNKDVKWKMLNVFMLIGFAVPILVYAASEYESDEKIALGVIGTAGTGATYELSPSKLFESEEDYGQDLYEFVYKRVKHEASDKAVERVLADGKLSKAELNLVISGTNIGEILKKEGPDVKLDPTTLENRRKEIQAFLVEEKELADLMVSTLLEVEQTEIFSNGDEADSGFDLLVDLDIIETILFAKTESVLGGAGPGAPPGSEVIGVGGGGGAGAGPAGAGPGGAGAGPGAGGAGAGAGAAGGAAAGGQPAEPSPEQEGVTCPLNVSFNQEVESVRAREREAGGAGGAGDGTAGAGGVGAGDAAGAGAGGAGGADSGAGEGEEKPPITPEPAGDFARPTLCGERFCLKVEAVYKTESAYLANENCIACHFEKINDSFKKTLDHNLVPSKATGNLMEGPKCKRSMLNLKWNFILIPQPILTPPNDDIITKGDFLANFVDFLEKYYRLPGSCDELKKQLKGGGNLQSALGLCKPPPDPEQEAARNALNQATEGTMQTDVIRKIRQQAAEAKAEVAEEMEKARTASLAENQAEQFQVVMQEIDTFNAYFKGFLTLYNQLISGEADSPCKTLENKATCS